MKSKPNIDAFLEGGAASDRSKVAEVEPAPAPGEFRKQMVMQLPVSLINELKTRALALSLQTGKRVTQQQLVEDALRIFLHR